MMDEQEQFFMDEVSMLAQKVLQAQGELRTAQQRLDSYREVKALYTKLNDTLSALYNSYDQDGDVLLDRVKDKINNLTAW